MPEKCFPVFFRELGPFLVPGFPFLATVSDARVGGNNNRTPPFFGIEEQGMEAKGDYKMWRKPRIKKALGQKNEYLRVMKMYKKGYAVVYFKEQDVQEKQ